MDETDDRSAADDKAPADDKTMADDRAPTEGTPMSEEEQRKMLVEAGAVVERVRDGELDSAEIEMPHGTMRVFRDAEDPEVLRVESVGDDARAAVAARTYPGAAIRPAAYPEALPFLPRCAASVSEIGGGRMRSAMWIKPEDPEAAFAEVRRQVLAMGWGEGSSIPVIRGMGPKRQAVFQRDGAEGTLTLLVFGEVAQVMWMEGTGKRS